jgi:putative DNA methylase
MAIKKEQLAQEVAKAVGAGKAVALETVDFNNQNRAKTCLEVDFPLVPINEIAGLEAATGALKKPVYKMSKWWARRQSSVFRAMLIAAATKAPDDPAHAAKLVWNNYYANHKKKGSFKHLKVADIFMGGGTTLVEGTRLGMQMTGNDLNPVAWFVVQQELADIDPTEVTRLLADIEAEVKPKIMPYYYCDGPQGEKGQWIYVPSGEVMPADFDPLAVPVVERQHYRYEGPEILYSFWAKHGPCHATGCGHLTPIMGTPVIATRTISVKCWEHKCASCSAEFDVEESVARMDPDAPIVVAPTERPYSVLDRVRGVVCPSCAATALIKLNTHRNKKVELSLLVNPQWFEGAPKNDASGQPFGGAAQDDAESTARWNRERAAKIRLLEVRGDLPDEVVCPETNVVINTRLGTVAKKSAFACASCGRTQDILESMTRHGCKALMAVYAVHGYSPKLKATGAAFGGRFFSAVTNSRQLDCAAAEWEARKEADLSGYWPRTELPEGFKTTYQKIPEHGYKRFADMFNPRQMLVLTQLLKAIVTTGNYDWKTREFVLGAFQQYLRCNNVFSIWHTKNNQISAALSNNNFHPRSTSLEPSVFNPIGDGSWRSAIGGLSESLAWTSNPWEIVSADGLKRSDADLAGQISGRSAKVFTGDCVENSTLFCGTSTNLLQLTDASFDLVITDPPFGNNVQYAELADFFYAWLRIALKDKYPSYFSGEHTPKALEAVDNPVRNPEDPQGYYKKLLAAVWRECARVLKQSGILAFTFHHSEDEPWVSVLESLFEAGFYLEAAYPIRSDETKGEGSKPGTFGSQQIEYDIIHVCRKRTEEPKPVSWGRMRREVMADVRQLQAMLENHVKDGLPAADIQVIRRGKALEHFSRHYGRVYVDEGRAISVREALVGINQLIDEDADKGKEPPPVNSEPMTRQFLRTFSTGNELKRDQLQKFLKGSITTPEEFVHRGWCVEKNKVFTRIDPAAFAREWSGKHRRRLISDLDQALVLTGACFDGSGINASDTLNNENFCPHVALKSLLEWLSRNGPDQSTRAAASRAVSIYKVWHASLAPHPAQASLFDDDGEYEV